MALGYTPLFLIVADIVRYAHAQGIPVNLRGSAAGSLVSYCLGISAVDPLALDLYFERFLNPERRDPPDIDLDLCSRRREEVIQLHLSTATARIGWRPSVPMPVCGLGRPGARWQRPTGCPRGRIDAVAREIPRFWHPGMGPEVEAAQEAAAGSRARRPRARGPGSRVGAGRSPTPLVGASRWRGHRPTPPHRTGAAPIGRQKGSLSPSTTCTASNGWAWSRSICSAFALSRSSPRASS